MANCGKRVVKLPGLRELRDRYGLTQQGAVDRLQRNAISGQTVLVLASYINWEKGGGVGGPYREWLRNLDRADPFVEGVKSILEIAESSGRAGPTVPALQQKGPGHSEETTRPLQDKGFSEPPTPPFSPMAELLELETLFLERLRRVSSDPVRTEKAVRSLYSQATARANSWHIHQFLGGELDEVEAAKVASVIERWSELADEAIHLSYQPFCYDRDNARRLRTITAADESQAKFTEAIYRALPEADWRNK